MDQAQQVAVFVGGLAVAQAQAADELLVRVGGMELKAAHVRDDDPLKFVLTLEVRDRAPLAGIRQSREWRSSW